MRCLAARMRVHAPARHSPCPAWRPCHPPAAQGLRKGAYDFATVPWRPEQAASLANPIMQLLLGLRREEDPNNAALWAASPPCTNR